MTTKVTLKQFAQNEGIAVSEASGTLRWLEARGVATRVGTLKTSRKGRPSPVFEISTDISMSLNDIQVSTADEDINLPKPEKAKVVEQTDAPEVSQAQDEAEPVSEPQTEEVG
jgi:hypothetical protein